MIQQKPMRVDVIQFVDGATLTNKLVVVTDQFLIVANDENDTEPTWYRIADVVKLERARAEQRQNRGRMAFG